jgi:hypothetical protein
MNFALPPDNDWDAIAELTGDDSWRSDKMRELFIDIENCTYAPEGSPGHGFGGFVQVRSRAQEIRLADKLHRAIVITSLILLIALAS